MQETTDSVREFYIEAFRAMGKDPAWPIDVSFYPYVGINHTIRVRSGRVYVRIAEICREMPASAHRGLAYILVSKLLRKRVPAAAREAYSNYIKGEAVREKAIERKRAKGRKVVTSAEGTFYDLNEVFDRLNAVYFGGNIPRPVLGWSARKTFRILGHHDSTHDTVVISRSLDSADVPRFVVEYVMYHEMLHIHHPTQYVNGRRYNHTPAFRRDERKFKFFDEAEQWIERNVRKLKKAAKRR